MTPECFKELQAARQAKRPVVLVTHLASGEQTLFDRHSTHADATLLEAVRDALRMDRSILLDRQRERLFLNVYNPPLRLLIVGAVHISSSLASMATTAGYEVVVIDPRQAWATAERMPDIKLVEGWPDDALAELEPDSRTAIITLTHDPKLDDPALAAALRSPAFYIGSLGSRRTHTQRLQRLREKGFSDEELTRIHGPLGLSIGAKTPSEIAISAMAEMTLILRSETGK